MPRTRTLEEHKDRGERAALSKPRKFSDNVVPVKLEQVKVRKGRRRELTSEEIDAFCRALDMPATFEVACGVIGIPVRTMNDWLSKGLDPDCQDEHLLELSAKYNAVMAGGNRGALMRLNAEHAIDDPKMAKWLSEVLMPGANVAKNMKVDVSVEARPQNRIPFELATDEELRVVEAYEKVVARLMTLV